MKIKNKIIQFLPIFFAVIFVFSGCQTTAPTDAAQKQSDQNIYMPANLYSELKAHIPDFPAKGSRAQKADEAELRKFQKIRSAGDCARAASEVVVSLKNLYGLPHGELSEQQINIILPFFDQIRHDGGPYISQIKNGYGRLRPYDYLTDLNPCVAKESSYAYPSGHATLSALYALVLSDLIPEKASSFKKRGDQIAQDRVLGGVHHPSDIEAGKSLGVLIYAELKKSKAYEADVQKYKKLLKEI